MMSPSPDLFQIPMPDDFHVHLREGQALAAYAARSAACFSTVMVMPNTLTPMREPTQIEGYRREIESFGRKVNPDFRPLMTFKIGQVEPGDLDSLMQAYRGVGVVAGKLYPRGATTHSEDGISDLKTLEPLFGAMERAGLVLSVHGEDPGAFVLDREAAFLSSLDWIAGRFPGLRLVLEHVSSRQGIEWVKAGGNNIAATVTVHHLLFTLDDLLGGSLNPFLFCKPLVKTPGDREAIQRVVLDAHPRFFFGSDSAPHSPEKKLSAAGAAGSYTAPVALPMLTGFFEAHGSLGLMTDFLSRLGRLFYGIPPDLGRSPGRKGSLMLEKKSWTVPELIDGVVPLCAGQTLAWQARPAGD